MGNAVRIKTFTILFLLFIVTAIIFGCSFVSTAYAQGEIITLYLNGGSIEGFEPTENGTVNFEIVGGENILPIPTKQGYTFLGWTKSESESDSEYITSISGETAIEFTALYARYVLKDPEITLQPSGYVGVYGEGGHTLSVTVTHELATEFTYQWYKDGILVENAQSNELKVTDVKQSGVYYVSIGMTVDGITRTVKSNNAIVRIQKAKVESTPQIIMEGVYSPDKTLNDYVLPNNYKWLDGGFIPKPYQRQYSAIFNVDSDNYFDYPCSVILIISKAEQEIFVEDLTVEYDGTPKSINATTSGDSVLEYSENNILTNVGKETVTITAPETEYYLEKSATAILEIVPQAVEIEWFDLQFTYNGKKQIPTAEAKDKAGLTVELKINGNGVDAGTHKAYAEALSKNYVLINPTVEYKIGKADYNADSIFLEDKEYVYDGKDHSLEIPDLPEWISVSFDKTACEVGYYTVTANFTVNNKNYNEIQPKTAKLTILQNSFKSDWYEIICPEGVKPNVFLRLEMIDDLDGLYKNHKGKVKYILGFRVVSSDDSIYEKPMTIKFNYESVSLDNLVLSVDKDSNEQIITYAYENGKVIIDVKGAEQNIVLAERSKGIAWIIVLVVGVCIAVSVGLYFILNKKPSQKSEEMNE